MKRLYRSTEDRMLGGVLGGIAEYFNIDSSLVRLVFVVCLFMSFFTLSLVYLAAVIIIPERGGF